MHVLTEPLTIFDVFFRKCRPSLAECNVRVPKLRKPRISQALHSATAGQHRGTRVLPCQGVTRRECYQAGVLPGQGVSRPGCYQAMVLPGCVAGQGVTRPGCYQAKLACTDAKIIAKIDVCAYGRHTSQSKCNLLIKNH